MFAMKNITNGVPQGSILGLSYLYDKMFSTHLGITNNYTGVFCECNI